MSRFKLYEVIPYDPAGFNILWFMVEDTTTNNTVWCDSGYLEGVKSSPEIWTGTLKTAKEIYTRDIFTEISTSDSQEKILQEIQMRRLME